MRLKRLCTSACTSASRAHLFARANSEQLGDGLDVACLDLAHQALVGHPFHECHDDSGRGDARDGIVHLAETLDVLLQDFALALLNGEEVAPHSGNNPEKLVMNFSHRFSPRADLFLGQVHQLGPRGALEGHMKVVDHDLGSSSRSLNGRGVDLEEFLRVDGATTCPVSAFFFSGRSSQNLVGHLTLRRSAVKARHPAP